MRFNFTKLESKCKEIERRVQWVFPFVNVEIQGKYGDICEIESEWYIRGRRYRKYYAFHVITMEREEFIDVSAKDICKCVMDSMYKEAKDDYRREN